MGKRLLHKHEELSSKAKKPRKTERCNCICSPGALPQDGTANRGPGPSQAN